MTPQSLAIEHIGIAVGELFGPLSLPPDEPFYVRNKVVASAFGNERMAELIRAACLDGSEFDDNDFVGLLSVLEAAVTLVQRYELVAS